MAPESFPKVNPELQARLDAATEQARLEHIAELRRRTAANLGTQQPRPQPGYQPQGYRPAAPHPSAPAPRAPSYSTPAEMLPQAMPNSSPQRVPRSFTSAPHPVSGEQPMGRRSGHGVSSQPTPRAEAKPEPKGKEVDTAEAVPRKKGLRRPAYAIGALVLLGGGGAGWNAWGDEVIDKVKPDSAVSSSTGEVSDEVVAPTVTGAEGFNMQNCTQEGAEIASLKITTGHYAMRYLLQLGEDPAPRVQPPYVTEGNMGEHEEFVTESGYPEMTVHDIVMRIYACQKDGASAVDSTAEGITINKNNLDFIAKPLLPEGNTTAVQTEAYMDDLEDGVIWTYPRDWLPVVDPANTEALKPVRDVHFTEAQQKGVFNTALATAIAGASTAAESDFFENVDFVGTQGRTLYSAIDQGLKQRLGTENVSLTGAVSAITAQDAAPDAKATLIDTTGDPEDTFKIVEGEVIVGHYKTEEDKE